jgi:hypothetical protein
MLVKKIFHFNNFGIIPGKIEQRWRVFYSIAHGRWQPFVDGSCIGN